MAEKTYGRYRVEALLGVGGMASVYRAHDPLFGRSVALKVLPRELLNKPESRVRFEREARTIASLEHAAIVPVYDFGEDDGVPFLVMRLMLGGSLRDRIVRGPMEPAVVAQVTERVAGALAAAHRRNIVHRDLKPGNILFDLDDRAYLADFGIVKLAKADATSLTAVGGIVGTPAYMSPEQVLSREDVELDARSDVYSLGILVYEMLTGRLPYQSNTPLGMAMMHVIEPVPRLPADLARSLPGCQEVLDRALAKEPRDRFAGAPELAAALREKLAGAPARSSHSATAGAATVIERTPPPDPRFHNTLERLHGEARAAMGAGNWDTAIARLNSMLALDPNYRDVISLLALANRQKRTAALLAEAQSALQSGAWERAQKLADEVTASDLRHAEAQEILRAAARLRRLAGDYEQAEKAIGGGDWAGAVALLEGILATEPGYRDAARLLPEAEAGRARGRQVESLWQKAEEDVQRRRWSAAQAGLEELLALDGAHEQAKQLLELVRVQQERGQQAHTLAEQAAEAASAGRWAEAVPLLEQAAELQPADFTLMVRLEEARRELELSRMAEAAEQAMAEERWTEALIAWQRLLEIEPERAEALAGVRRSEEGRERELRLVEVAAWRERAEAREAEGDWDEAVFAWERALALEPGDPALQQASAAARAQLRLIEEEARTRREAGLAATAAAAAAAAKEAAAKEAAAKEAAAKEAAAKEAAAKEAAAREAAAREAAAKEAAAKEAAAKEAARKAAWEAELLRQYRAAEALERGEDWRGAAMAWYELEQESPGFRDVARRLESARSREAGEAERLRRLTPLLAAGAAAEQAGRWAEAARAWTAALELSPGDGQIAAKRDQARAALQAESDRVAREAAVRAAREEAAAEAAADERLKAAAAMTAAVPAGGAAQAGAETRVLPPAEPPRQPAAAQAAVSAPAATPMWQRPALIVPVMLLALLLCVGGAAVLYFGGFLSDAAGAAATATVTAGATTGPAATAPAATVPPATAPGEVQASETPAVAATESGTPAESDAPTATETVTPEPTETSRATATAGRPSPTATQPAATPTRAAPTATNPPPSATSAPPTATSAPPPSSTPLPPPTSTAPPAATSTPPPPPASATPPPPPPEATATAPPPPEPSHPDGADFPSIAAGRQWRTP